MAHVSDRVDPARDAEIVETELMLADMESLERMLAKAEKKARGAGEEAKDAAEDKRLIQEILGFLEKGEAFHAARMEEDEALRRRIRSWQILTAKPVLYVANAEEKSGGAADNPHLRAARAHAEKHGASLLAVSARLEEELALFSAEERMEYLKSEGLAMTGLEEIIRETCALLRLITFFTVGEKETRAWTIPQGATASRAAGRIHGDFEKGFIRAEIVGYEDFLAHQGWQGARTRDGCVLKAETIL